MKALSVHVCVEQRRDMKEDKKEIELKGGYDIQHGSHVSCQQRLIYVSRSRVVQVPIKGGVRVCVGVCVCV